jgi:hypothetical protein
MSKYIICTSKDWADEFDYPIFSIFGEKTKRTLLLYNNYLEDEDLAEIYFGSNESFSFNKEEIVNMIQQASVITEEEIQVFNKYMPYPTAVDIVDRILELLYEKIDDTGNQDLLKKLEELDQLN